MHAREGNRAPDAPALRCSTANSSSGGLHGSAATAAGRKRPKLLIVGPLPPPLGGVQLMIEMQLRSVIAKDFDVKTVDTSKRQLRWAVENPTWRTPLYFIRDFFRLLTALMAERPDAVLVHAAPSLSFLRDWVLMLTSRLAGAKVICHYHGTTHTRFPSCVTDSGKRTGRFLMRAANRVIVLGPTYQLEMGASWHRSDIAWAPNVVDLNLFKKDSGDGIPPRDGKTILFVGRLSAPKGIWDLIDAMAKVLGRFPDAKLVLVGVAENLERESLVRREVERRGLSRCVEFRGSLEGRQKAMAFLAADMLVVPSWTEAFPLVIPEAMAAGLPIIATSVGAIPDFVKDGVDGYLVPAKNPAALAKRICELLGNDSLRIQIGNLVVERARIEFAIDVGSRRVADVIHDALGNKIHGH